MTEEAKPHSPYGVAPHAGTEKSERAGLDAQTFAHLTYGELVKQFGREASLHLKSWDALPEAEREKFMSAMAVIHAQVFPHGPPASDRYVSAQAQKH